MEKFTPADEEMIARIRVLSEQVWEQRIKLPDIELWLENFAGEFCDISVERSNALHLLAHFNYFGLAEIKVLLRTVFMDLFRYPIVQEIRQRNEMTADVKYVQSEFASELRKTRFLGVGNPSESGAHLLYLFRQVNHLETGLFIDEHQLLRQGAGQSEELAIPSLRRLVFIDDILGSGQQMLTYTGKLLDRVKQAADAADREIEISYFVLFAKEEGLTAVRAESAHIDHVHAVHELDSSETAFGPESRVFATTAPPVEKGVARDMASHYGRKLLPGHALGYRNGQLMLGLHHNVPDNTLPIFWFDDEVPDWTSIFPRQTKV